MYIHHDEYTKKKHLYLTTTMMDLIKDTLWRVERHTMAYGKRNILLVKQIENRRRFSF